MRHQHSAEVGFAVEPRDAVRAIASGQSRSSGYSVSKTLLHRAGFYRSLPESQPICGVPLMTRPAFQRGAGRVRVVTENRSIGGGAKLNSSDSSISTACHTLVTLARDLVEMIRRLATP
jgi:hypothetical protein